MAQPLGLVDLESTIELAIHLSEFSNLAFSDSSLFTKIGVNELKYWADHVQPLPLVLKHLLKLEGILPNMTEIISQVISTSIDVLKTGTNIGEEGWVNSAVDKIGTGMVGLLEAMTTLVTKLAGEEDLNGDSTQIYFRHFTEVVMAIDILKNSIASEYFRSEHLDTIIAHCRLALDGIASVAVSRLRQDRLVNQVEALSSTPVLNWTEDDIIAIRLIGFHVHELASYAMASYK